MEGGIPPPQLTKLTTMETPLKNRIAIDKVERFTEYFNEFYGKDGIYPVRDIHSYDMMRVLHRLYDDPDKFLGDSMDREKVREDIFHQEELDVAYGRVIKYEATVTFTHLESMFISAYEGGSNYWATAIEEVDEPTEKYIAVGLAPSERHFRHVWHGGTVNILIDEEDEPVLMTKEKMVLGTQLMQSNQQKHFAEMINQSGDACTADVWFQLCLFGEVIYG